MTKNQIKQLKAIKKKNYYDEFKCKTVIYSI